MAVRSAWSKAPSAPRSVSPFRIARSTCAAGVASAPAREGEAYRRVPDDPGLDPGEDPGPSGIHDDGTFFFLSSDDLCDGRRSGSRRRGSEAGGPLAKLANAG